MQNPLFHGDLLHTLVKHDHAVHERGPRDRHLGGAQAQPDHGGKQDERKQDQLDDQQDRARLVRAHLFAQRAHLALHASHRGRAWARSHARRPTRHRKLFVVAVVASLSQ